MPTKVLPRFLRAFGVSLHAFLAGIAAKSVDFFRVLYKSLATRVNHLQTLVINAFQESKEGSRFEIIIERDILPYFKALLAADEKVREVTVALVKSQVEETAARVLAVGASHSLRTNTGSSSTPLVCHRHPTNLWRKISAMTMIDM